MGKGSVFMKKNFLIMVIVLALVMCFAVAVSAQTYYEPYTLSYNSNHKDTGWYRGGPHAGWVLDNRGGTPLSVNSIEYNTFQDTSTEHASSFYKNLNKVDEGVVTLETSFKANLTDSRTDSGEVCGQGTSSRKYSSIALISSS